MGDHRSASADSKQHMTDRYSGTIAVDDVIGKAALIVWPVSRFGTLDSPDIQEIQAAGALVSGVAGPVTPLAVGFAGAVPLVLWRRERRASRDV
jgi:signal peptidase I